MTELDAQIVEAFEALDGTIPAGYFDDFETRLQARLEDDAMTQIAEDDNAALAGDNSAAIPVSKADADELRDIRALAAKTKARVSQRMEAAKSEPEPLISSVSLALKAISLPEPGKDFKFFALEDSPKAAAAVAREDQDSGLPTWIYAAISAVAAAAVVFFLLRGDKQNDKRPNTSDRAAPTEVAQLSPGERAALDKGAPGNGTMNPSSPEAASDPSRLGMPPADGTAGTALGQDPGVTAPDSVDSAGVLPGVDPTAGTNGTAPTAPADGAPATAETTAKVASKASKKRSSARSKSARKTEDSDAKPVETKKPAKKVKKKPDTLESLLSEASGTDKKADKKKKKKPDAKDAKPAVKPGRTEIKSSEIRPAMGKLSGKTRACYEKHQKTGLVKVKFSVAPSGQVTSAAATGKFKGTDTGKCVSAAVKTVKFEPYNGPPMRFTWPFLLSQ